MKTKKTLIILIALTMVIFQSCKKDDSKEEVQVGLSADESAELIATSVCSDSYGYTQQMEDAAMLAGESKYKSGQGMMYDSSFTVTSVPGAYIYYSYSLAYDFGLQTVGNSTIFYLDFSTSGNYETPRTSSNDNGSGSFDLDNCFNAETFYVLNGSASRYGTQVITILQQRTYTSTIEATFTDIEVDKMTYEILSGECSVKITGTTSSGFGFTVNGTLVFNGDGTITLTIGGSIYEIDYLTGEIISET
jgi:hypothetical protein